MDNFNDIGIESKLDWDRVMKLFRIGICGAVLVLVGDMLLGWGVEDANLSGIERYLSRYLTVSDTRIFWASILGMIGIPLEVLCYFGIYRLVVEKSRSYAHKLRTGIIGMLMFGAFVHVMCCVTVFFYKKIYMMDPAGAVDTTLDFAMKFLVPPTVVFLSFMIYMAVVQAKAFLNGLTPYPKWCAVFLPVAGMVVVLILKLFGNHEIVNAISTGWISIGNIWMFGGLIAAKNC